MPGCRPSIAPTPRRGRMLKAGEERNKEHQHESDQIAGSGGHRCRGRCGSRRRCPGRKWWRIRWRWWRTRWRWRWRWISRRWCPRRRRTLRGWRPLLRSRPLLWSRPLLRLLRRLLPVLLGLAARMVGRLVLGRAVLLLQLAVLLPARGLRPDGDALPGGVSGWRDGADGSDGAEHPGPARPGRAHAGARVHELLRIREGVLPEDHQRPEGWKFLPSR